MLVLTRRVGESLILDATGKYPTTCTVFSIGRCGVALTFRSCSGEHNYMVPSGELCSMCDTAGAPVIIHVLKATDSKVSIGIQASTHNVILRSEVQV